MSLVSYLSLSPDPGKMAYEARKTLRPYRTFLERQIQCIDKCNVVKKAEWTLLPNETENTNKSDKDANSDNEKTLYKIRLTPISDNDDLDIFFTDENIIQLYTIDPVEDNKKIKWDNFKVCKKILVVDFDEEEYTLTLDQNPSKKWIAIRPDTYQLRKQLEAIDRLYETPNPRLSPITRLLVDSNGRPNLWNDVDQKYTEDSVDWQLLKDTSFDGVNDQRQFVLNVLNTPEFAFLEGPPGSGKTRAICEAIRLLITEGKRVLLCASTHVAVDNVLERLMDEKYEWRKQIIPIRIAQNETRISSDIAKKYSLRRFVKEEKKRISKELKNKVRNSAHNAMIELVEKENDAADGLMRLILDSANLVCGTTIGILQHPDIKFSSDSMAPFDYLIIDEASKTTFQEFLVPAMWAKHWILVGDVNQLSPYVDDAELSNNLQYYCTDETLRNIASDIFHITTKNKNEHHGVLVECDDETTKELYIKHCAHTHATYIDLDRGKRFDGNENAIYLGKAGKIEIAYKWIRQQKTGRFLIRQKGQSAYKLIEGKKRQDSSSWETDLSWRIATSYDLRKSEQSKNRERLNEEINQLCDLMQKISDNDVRPQIERLRHVALPSVLELLKDGFNGEHEIQSAITNGLPDDVYNARAQRIRFQHRMHPEIAELSKKYIYDNEALNSSAKMADSRSTFWPCSRHILWTGSMKSHAVLEDEKQKNANSHECHIIMKKMEEFVEWAKKNPNPEEKSNGIWEVAILSFYQGQERMLWRTFAQKREQWEKIIRLNVCTIDRFQGHEADLVFISFVKSYPTSFLLSQNRLNVALTRAKYQCFLVGNREALRHSLEKDRQNEFLYHITNEIDYEKTV